MRLTAAVLLCALVAAAAASGLTLLLHGVAHLATGGGESYANLVPWRRVVTALALGAGAGLAWWWLRSRGPLTSLDAVRTDPTKTMPLARTIGDAVITVLAVGAGAPVGRETAPRQIAAAGADSLTRRLGLPDDDRLLLMAAASAAGLAAVYNAPLAGIAYCAEVVRRGWSRRATLLAIPTCVLATVLAWPVVGSGANLPHPHGSALAWWWGAPLGVVAAALGLAYRRLTEWGRDATAPTGRRLVGALTAAGLALGIATWWLPDLTGNGRAAIGAVLHASPSVAVLVGLLLVKPLLTTGFLRAGAVGGVLAPALAAGACAGALVAHGIGQPGLAPGLAVACAGSVLSVTQRAPLFGPLLAYEMTRPPLDAALALALATLVAQALLRAGARRR